MINCQHCEVDPAIHVLHRIAVTDEERSNGNSMPDTILVCDDCMIEITDREDADYELSNEGIELYEESNNG